MTIDTKTIVWQREICFRCERMKNRVDYYKPAAPVEEEKEKKDGNEKA